MTSAAMYSAIAIFVIIFIFPQTVNHAYLSLVSRLLGIIKVVMSMQDEILLDPRDIETKIHTGHKLKGAMYAILRGRK